jgi:hypothetical protein
VTDINHRHLAVPEAHIYLHNGAMRSALRLFAVWIAVTVVAVGAAWFGLRAAIQSPRDPGSSRSGVDTSIVVSTLVSASPSPSATPVENKITTTVQSPSPSPSPSAEPTPSPTKKAPPPKPKATPAPKVPGPKTVELQGGTVELFAKNGRVEVGDVRVRNGYSGRGWREGDGTVVIEFRSRDHVSTLRSYLRADCGLCTDTDERDG